MWRQYSRILWSGKALDENRSCGKVDAIMPVLAIFFLLAGAILHTAWNILLKNSEDKYITTWWMVFQGGIFSLIALLFIGLPSKDMWIFILFSVLVEVVYFITL